MRKIILTIKENWNDPVWSKVIATSIITLLGFVFTTLYALFKFLIAKISFTDSFLNIWSFLGNTVSINNWIIIILLIIYPILVIKPLIKFLRDVFRKILSPKEESLKQDEEIILPRANENSTSLFSQRMAIAFPGIREITWFDNSKIARQRLEKLLKQPLNFRDGTLEYEVDPIWWFRGGSALNIHSFQKIGINKVLMNFEQLQIKRIAAIRGNSYYKDFVYVETKGEKQTGLYKHTENDIKRHLETFGYSSEEYGVIKNSLGWKKPIRREDYDDGATVIRGKVRDDIQPVLRVRYLTDYNFIIAAKGSPYNSTKFCVESEKYFNGILKKEIAPEDFFKFLESFKKYEQ